MFPPDADPAEVTTEAQVAEELGFDFFACGEHLFFHVPTTNAFIALAAAAGATTRIRLLSALTILPVYPAVVAAKLAITLDRVSGGRFELGVGVGGEYPPEFDAAGVPVQERGRRTDESLALLQHLETGEPVSFAGQFTTIDRLAMLPSPVQDNGLPVWVGGRSKAAMRRAARFGDVWLPYMMTPDNFAAAVPQARAMAEKYGRAPEQLRAGIFCWSAVAEDAAWARRAAIESVSTTYRQDFTDLADRYLVSGSREQVVDRISQYAEAGATEMIFAPACPPADRPGVVRFFAEWVMPLLQSLVPACSGAAETAVVRGGDR